MVAFQWRKVWKVILSSRGFLVLAEILFLVASKILAVVLSCVPPKTFLDLFGSSVSRSISRFETLQIRGLLCFSGSMLMVLLFGSMSVHSSFHASPHLAPVSFRS